MSFDKTLTAFCRGKASKKALLDQLAEHSSDDTQFLIERYYQEGQLDQTQYQWLRDQIGDDHTQMDPLDETQWDPNTLDATERKAQSVELEPTEYITRIAPSDETIVDLDSTQVTVSPASFGVHLKPGTVIKDRFVLETRLGRGGMGSVYKARDKRKEEAFDKDRHIAIKFLNRELRDNPQALIALQREAKKAQALAHPNIVTVFDYDRDGDLVYLTMEYLEGQTLEQLINSHSHTGLEPDAAMSITKHIARGLTYAHNKGYAHADLKPSNIFVTDKSEVKLLDFGIAQAVKAAGVEPRDDETRFDPYSLGAITPNYASPEMLNDKTPQPSDDMYSLGCIIYALFTGKHPFLDGNQRKLTALKAIEKNLKPLKIPKLQRRYQKALFKCLDFDGTQRYQNAAEFINDFEPRSQLKRTVLGLLIGTSLAATISWWILASQSEAAIRLNDLPSNMSEIVSTLTLGDQSLEHGDIDQAHKLYAQAWESSFDQLSMAPRDQAKLKVLVDRRINNIIKAVIKQSQAEELDDFSLLQIEIALKSLQASDLGTMDNDIEEALSDLEHHPSKAND